MKWHDTTTPYRDRTSRGTGSTVTEHAAGFTIRTRGDTSGAIEHEYECPVHGRFKRDVPRAAVPDSVMCDHREEPRMFDLFGADAAQAERIRALHTCKRESLWCAPLVGVGHAPGEVTS